MGPVALSELTEGEGDGKGMIRTGNEHNFGRIAEVSHPKREPPRYYSRYGGDLGGS
jgi:hypothetical protein